jgi:hypothetical protein
MTLEGVKMKTLKLLSLVLLIGFLFIKCDTGTSNVGNTSNETININNLSVKTTDIKSLYISNIPVNSSNRVIQTLSYINNTGQNTPFFFVSPSGKNIVLNVSELRQLDNKRIVVNFSSYYEIIIEDNVYTIGKMVSVGDGLNTWKTALIDFEKNTVYDFTDWNIQIIENDTIYAFHRDRTIYKISMNNISTAIPLNNSTYFPLDHITPRTTINNKIIGEYLFYSHYVIDIDNNFPITPIKHAQITHDMCSFIPSGDTFIAEFYGFDLTGVVIQDHNGDTWFFKNGGKIPTLSYNKNVDFGEPQKYFIGKISIDDSAQVSLTDYYENTLSFTPIYDSNAVIYLINSANNGEMSSLETYSTNFSNTSYYMLVYTNGFITLKKKSTGIQIESTALSMPVNLGGYTFIKDNYLYYLEETDIKRLYLSSGNAPETIYSNNRIITSGSQYSFLSVSGNNIIFYQFADDNISVNTYSLALYGMDIQPKLLSSVSADIQNIIELDF